MIRSVPRADFSFRASRSTPALRRAGRPRHMGAASLATAALSSGISAGVSLATSAISDWMNSIQLSHDADSATTAIVNGLAIQLSNLDSAYFAEQNVTCADQRAALDAYDESIAWLQSSAACGNPAYGAAGNACIADRVGANAKYPWVQYYRDPIANDPRLSSAGCDTGSDVILPSATTGSYADTGITSTGGSSSTGQTATQIAAAAVAAASTPATTTSATTMAAPTTTTTIAGIPSTYVYVGLAALAALLIFKD